MYTKPIIYKIYSVIAFVLGIVGFCGSLFLAVTGGVILNKFFGSFSASVWFVICAVVSALISLFFAYVEFSSMFTFAEMIQHEESGATEPFRRKGFVLPAKFYKVFGSIMFYIPLIIDFIAIVVLVIVYSAEKSAFIAIPILPIVCTLIGLLLIYITFYCRFRTFGDLLDLKSSEEPQISTLNSMAESKPNMLRGYCGFMFIMAILTLIGAVISMFLVGSAGAGAVIGTLIGGIISFIVYGIIGCYYDNLAKMLEHYMMKHKLL